MRHFNTCTNLFLFYTKTTQKTNSYLIRIPKFHAATVKKLALPVRYLSMVHYIQIGIYQIPIIYNLCYKV